MSATSAFPTFTGSLASSFPLFFAFMATKAAMTTIARTMIEMMANFFFRLDTAIEMPLDFAKRYNARERKWFQRGEILLERLELFPRIRLGIHLVMDLGDATLLVDDIRNAAGVFVTRSAGGAVGQADFPVGVTEQRKGKFVLLGKAGVVLNRVKADAEDLGVLRFVLVGQVPEPGTLGRSTAGVGLGEEPQHDFLAAKVTELHATAAMIGRFEIRGRIAHFEHWCTSSNQTPDEPQFSADRHPRIVRSHVDRQVERTLPSWRAGPRLSGATAGRSGRFAASGTGTRSRVRHRTQRVVPRSARLERRGHRWLPRGDRHASPGTLDD